MNRLIFAALAGALVLSGAAVAQDASKPRTDKNKLALFEGGNFDRRMAEVRGARPNINLGFTVSSIAIYPGEKWEVCGGTRYREPCMTLSGDTQDLNGITVASARPVTE